MQDAVVDEEVVELAETLKVVVGVGIEVDMFNADGLALKQKIRDVNLIVLVSFQFQCRIYVHSRLSFKCDRCVGRAYRMSKLAAGSQGLTKRECSASLRLPK